MAIVYYHNLFGIQILQQRIKPMKKLTILCSMLCLMLSMGNAQTETTPKTEIEIKVGTQLVYEVNSADDTYQFIVTIKKLGKEIAFDWEMTAPINQKGTIEMTKEALKSSRKLHNYFTSGTTRLTDKTSVWISESMWNAIYSDEGAVNFAIEGDNNIDEYFANEDFEFDVKYKGKTVQMDVTPVTSLFSGKGINIWKNKDFPIITGMKLGFMIELKEIK